jgi:tRNA threonylcarbamoyladenosine biosynthesis protein TsaB
VTILAVDTALGACSAAVIDGDKILAHHIEFMERGHAEALAPMVEAAMGGLSFAGIDRLAVTTGPGTFTGQRIGLAFMRGLRVALHKPLTGITSLAAMAAAARAETGCATAAALHDARRGEVYLEVPGVQEPVVLAFDDAVALLARLNRGVALAGTGAPAAHEKLAGSILSSIRQPDALWVARLALEISPSDDAPRPLYLRAPDAKLPGAA